MVNEISAQLANIQPNSIELGNTAPALKPQDPNAPAFEDVLSGLIKDVDQAQQDADSSITQLKNGEATSIQDVVLKLEEADIAFQMMKEVRNKLVEAYKEVMSQS